MPRASLTNNCYLFQIKTNQVKLRMMCLVPEPEAVPAAPEEVLPAVDESVKKNDFF